MFLTSEPSRSFQNMFSYEDPLKLVPFGFGGVCNLGQSKLVKINKQLWSIQHPLTLCSNFLKVDLVTYRDNEGGHPTEVLFD